MNKQLFDTSIFKKLFMKNRFFRASVWENMADQAGNPTPEIWQLYEGIAKEGVGNIITGYAYVTKNEQPNTRMLGIYDDAQIRLYQPLTQMVHEHGANIFLQIVYGGGQTDLVPPSKHILAPSSVEYPRSGVTPFAMTKADIDSIVDAFAQAALRAKKAGFDGVEIHAAHGYMLSQLLSPYFNHRKDEYGGSIVNRTRMIGEIICKCRLLVGDDFPILMKINCEDFHPDGLSREDAKQACVILSKLGLDAIEVSGGNSSIPQVAANNLEAERTGLKKTTQSYFKEHAKDIAEAINIPVILTGGNKSFDVMEDILNSSKIEYFGLARGLICQPNLISLWKTDQNTKVRCVSCGKCSYAACILNKKPK